MAERSATVRRVSDSQIAVAQEAAALADAMQDEVETPRAISVEGVWKTFRLPHDRPSTLKQRVLHPTRSRAATELHALRDVSFDVEQGEFFGIIGRNGSGKSTMLKCLAGIYQPGQGNISVSGRVSPFIELGVGFHPELTALDNVVVNAALLGIPRREAVRRFPDVIRFAELEQFVDLKLKNYSSGMQVRLGFAAAIQAEADIYLVDEVLAVGDARFQEKCFETFRQLKRSGQTVIYVTHDLGTVERFCDRALLLERGEVQALGPPREVIHAYRRLSFEQEQAERADVDREGTRWGDGRAVIEDAWFEDARGERLQMITQGEPVSLVARICFRESMEEPIFGTILKNERGDHVFVTNTMFDGIETGRFEAGERADYRVKFEMLLADGRYTASPAVAYQDGQRFADWWEDAVSALVRAERYTSGIVDLPHRAAVERAGDDRTRAAPDAAQGD
jgi:ABC-type polysaccharide/polyol phosphate transport system ATPase subunit